MTDTHKSQAEQLNSELDKVTKFISGARENHARLDELLNVMFASVIKKQLACDPHDVRKTDFETATKMLQEERAAKVEVEDILSGLPNPDNADLDLLPKVWLVLGEGIRRRLGHERNRE